jgi:hypothetical protein
MQIFAAFVFLKYNEKFVMSVYIYIYIYIYEIMHYARMIDQLIEVHHEHNCHNGYKITARPLSISSLIKTSRIDGGRSGPRATKVVNDIYY